MGAAPIPVEVFCSYAHADEIWRQKLETHLSLLRRQGLVSLWHDLLIRPGTDWAEAISNHLETASVILLLVSADFLASDYCYSVEMQRALERQEAGEARVVPILVRPVDWTGAPFAHLQPLPIDAKPISSWPDEDRALADVAAGIRRVIEDVPLLVASVPRAALPPVWNVPFPRNPFFLGREGELAQVRERLRGGQSTTHALPLAISGLGGIGKTQLALEYAYRYHQGYQTVLWASAESAEALISSYRTFASLLQLPEREAKEQEIIVQAVKTWLQTHRDWLLILDNADELQLLPDFLPPSAGGHVLLTTRATATGRLAQRLEIGTLLPEQGALFLLRRAAVIAPDTTLQDVSREERELALLIAHEVGSLPLALDQAGAYLEETGTNLTTYWQLYQRHRTDLLRERGGLVGDHPLPVATTWSVSFQRVEARNPTAADLLRLLAFLAPDAIAEEIITQGAPHLGPRLAPVAAEPYLFGQAMEALRAYSLVRQDPHAHTLSMHRMVQTVLRDSLTAEERKQWAMRAVLVVNATFPEVEFASWTRCERYLPQALACAHWVEKEQIASLEAARLLLQTGMYLTERGQYPAAKPLLQSALTLYEQEVGAEHLQTVTCLSNLARLSVLQGNYEQAEPLYKITLSVRERQLGAEHPDVASTLNSLADAYVHQSKYQQAEPLYLRALAIREHHFGVEHSETASSLNSLGWLYREQGKYEQAEGLLQRALAIRERHVGAEHPATLASCNNLARLYLRWGKYVEAERLLDRALAIRERWLGPEHPATASNLNSLAELYQLQGRYEEAERLLKRALAIREHHLGAGHPDTASSLNNLAWLYRDLGRCEEAEPLLMRALTIRERRLGSEHPSTAQSLNNLAGLSVRQGRYEQAERYYQRALAIRERHLGVDHPSVAMSLNKLAELYQIQGRHEQAEPFYRRALSIDEQQLGVDHPITRMVRANYLALQHSGGLYREIPVTEMPQEYS